MSHSSIQRLALLGVIAATAALAFIYFQGGESAKDRKPLVRPKGKEPTGGLYRSNQPRSKDPASGTSPRRRNAKKQDDPEKAPLWPEARTNDNQPNALSPDMMVADRLVAAIANGTKVPIDRIIQFYEQIRIRLIRAIHAEKNDSRTLRLLASLDLLHSIRPLTETPQIIITLARQKGTTPVRNRAIHLAGRVGDPEAVNLLAEILRFLKEEKDWRIPVAAITASGYTVSRSLAHLLERKIVSNPDSPYYLDAIEALGNIGVGVSRSQLASLAKEAKRIEVRQAAKFALSKAEILATPGRANRLIETVASSMVSGNFAWYEWALDKVVRLGMNELASDLRRIYDKKKNVLTSGPLSFKTNLLAAIYKLGGDLLADEVETLRASGRIPP